MNIYQQDLVRVLGEVGFLLYLAWPWLFVLYAKKYRGDGDDSYAEFRWMLTHAFLTVVYLSAIPTGLVWISCADKMFDTLPLDVTVYRQHIAYIWFLGVLAGFYVSVRLDTRIARLMKAGSFLFYYVALPFVVQWAFPCTSAHPHGGF